MAISIILGILVFLGLGVVFTIALLAKGWKVALITTAIVGIISILLYVAAITAITNAMG